MTLGARWGGPRDLNHRESRRSVQNSHDCSGSHWLRTSRTRPCPVCSKRGWCGVSRDGNAAICMRVKSCRPTANGGWLHLLGLRRPRYPWQALPILQRLRSDLDRMATECSEALSHDRIGAVAECLGPSSRSLRELALGAAMVAVPKQLRRWHRRRVEALDRCASGLKRSSSPSWLGCDPDTASCEGSRVANERPPARFLVAE